MKSKLKMGMIGGGKGAFIGAIHRIASNMDGLAELVCGAFSSDEKTAMESGKSYFFQKIVLIKIISECLRKKVNFLLKNEWIL